MLLRKRMVGTATLILTPNLIHRFGASFHAGTSLAPVNELYQEAIKTSFRPLAESKTIYDFETRIENAISIYSKQYDQILREFIDTLGESRFKIEYIKEIVNLSREFSNPQFSYLDLSELFRRHFAGCTNAATNEEEIFQSGKLNAVDKLLRTSNYCLTFLTLLLESVLAGPAWLVGELHRRTAEALQGMEPMIEIYRKSKSLAGSLVIMEGNIDPEPETRKER